MPFGTSLRGPGGPRSSTLSSDIERSLYLIKALFRAEKRLNPKLGHPLGGRKVPAHEVFRSSRTVIGRECGWVSRRCSPKGRRTTGGAARGRPGCGRAT
ncbi:hypothetical protein SAM23877_3999 [Streptomyces ambofaciens ATCC 23877]|uniref:Uncharacterized protein n=1 Tax=Streptomyces ambofaciens (strain ATCC 23877 / 3486 / DSM 40053 / JCM 4204 / NBRC 12836 / NRRL B-2516) TaxID=278992 RepID=A0A0K2AVL2_STRA7|nr:hypothetical protein SAM23877_3999 [Streptomyces ambofaciens ATCC 23877]